MTHTPTPCGFIKQSDHHAIFQKENPKTSFANVTGKDWANSEANAKFIVRACNTHDYLVEALELLLFSPKNPVAIRKAKEVLAKVKGE